MWRCIHLYELYVLIEFGLALVALGQEVETDTSDVLARLELLRAVHVVALYLQFHHAPVPQAHLVASAQVVVDNGSEDR